MRIVRSGIRGANLSAQREALDFVAFSSRHSGRPQEFPPPLLYATGTTLFSQGSPCSEVFYLEHGMVKLLRIHSNGEERIVGLRSAGWFLAAASVVLEAPYEATAITLTPCDISRLGARLFRHLLVTSPVLSVRLHRMHSEEIHGQLSHVAELSSVHARERLLEFLRRLAPALVSPSQAEIVVPLRQWEIAQLLGITPSYLCQLMREMVRKKIVRWHKQLLLLRPESLSSSEIA